MSGQRCSFHFDPKAWSEAHDERCWVSIDEFEGKRWECPHPPVDGLDRCPFHAEPTDLPAHVSQRDAFLDAVHSDKFGADSQVEKQFLGATFRGLDLSNALLSSADRHWIDLRHAHIEGDFVLTNGTVEQPLLCNGLTVSGNLTAERAKFTRRVEFAGTRFAGVNLKHAHAEQSVSFYGASVANDLRTYDAAFDKEITLECADIAGKTYLKETKFDGNALLMGLTTSILYVEESRFDRHFSLSNATIGELTIHQTRATDGVTLVGTTVTSDAEIHVVAFNDVELNRTTVEQELDLRGTVKGTVSFETGRVGGQATFQNLVVEEELRLGATLERGASLSDATIQSLELEADDGAFDLRGATVCGGRLVVEGGSAVNLAGATLGNIAIAPLGTNLLRRVNVSEVIFDGFDFTAHKPMFAATRWRLHDTLSKTSRRQLDISHGQTTTAIETTYLRAKNGASDVGNQSAAAEFFRRQMMARRLEYRKTVRDAPLSVSGAVAGFDYLRNLGFGLVAGHGERPIRVIGTAMLIIVGFAVCYRAVLPADSAYLEGVGPLLLSFESFITLVLGGGGAVSQTWIRLLAEIEGFTGAFIIALFVFTLTRSVHR